MKHYPDTPEGFQQFLRDGVERSKLYRPGAEKVAEPPKEANVVRLKDVVSNIEGADWKLKAAGEDWDGIEDVIEEGVDEDI